MKSMTRRRLSHRVLGVDKEKSCSGLESQNVCRFHTKVITMYRVYPVASGDEVNQ